jgi:hypothetical protein
LTLRNHPFEITIFERMIFDVNREAFVAGNETRPVGDRPTLQDTVEFEPKVIMQRAGSMFLDDETQSFRLGCSARGIAARRSMVFEKSRLRR